MLPAVCGAAVEPKVDLLNKEPLLPPDCCVGELKILPPSAALLAPDAVPNSEPAVLAAAVEPNVLEVAALPPPNIEPAAGAPKPVDGPPPNMLPPVAAAGLEFAAAAANKPVLAGWGLVFAALKRDGSGLGTPPNILPD